jgi:calcium permeable stress-gated cation channel
VRDARLWATLLCEYFVAAVVVFFLHRDYARYAEYRREYRTVENPANYSVVVHDIPEGMNTEVAVRDRFELMLPGQVSEVVMARKNSAGIKAEALLVGVISKKERAEFLVSTTGASPEHRPGCCGALMCWKPKVNSVDFFTQEKERLEAAIADEAASAPNARSAIVVFNNKRAASLIAQANQGTNADEWTVFRAGEPDAVHWPAFHIPGYQAVWRSLAVIAFVFFLTFFWMIPVAIITGLASLEKLTSLGAFKWADGIRDLSPAVVGLIENALPAIILSVFLSFIPTFIRLAVSHTRLHSLHLIDSKTRNYYYIFTIFASFVFIVLGSAALNELKAMIDNPGSIPTLLANAIPKNSLFFTSFILVSTFIPLSLQLLNPSRLIIRWLKLKIAKTERERRAAEETGSVFEYFRAYGAVMMMSLLGITYSTLAPLVTLTALIYIAISFVVFKHNIVFASHRKWDGAGWDYPGAFWGVAAGLLIKQLTMVGVLALYEGAGQSVLALPPAIFTILFGVWCQHRFARVSLHGSLHDQYTEASKADEIPARYAGLYLQPGMSVPPYVNLSGMQDPMDVYAEEDETGMNSDDAILATVKSEYTDSEKGHTVDNTAHGKTSL